MPDQEHTAPQPIREVHAGFIPLLDCAPLVIARELGFDRRCGFSLRLHREVSWANIRDKVDIGAFDCAHMLAPMPLATALGLGRATEPVVAPLSLNLNGNAITVSSALFSEMLDADSASAGGGGMGAAKAVAQVVGRRRAQGREPLTLGMVFPFSSHNYDLRCWLAAAGIDPDADVNLIVIPPPLLSESLRAGRVDGFCVGAPWNSVSVASGHGMIVATKNQLWPRSPEKVLGIREAWVQKHPELTSSLVRALVMAARWVDDPANRREAARILASPRYVGVAEDMLFRLLDGKIVRGGQLPVLAETDMIVFHRGMANFPWRSHALWLMTQMIRWGQVREPFDLRAVAERVYRPDIYRRAVASLGVEVPAGDYKREGVDFFGAETFDPQAVMGYLQGLRIRSNAVDLARFAPLNG
jgi:NitT/TauT family transport system ATP-binding protein/nitrate/nitrite transport system substrate-binding protein